MKYFVQYVPIGFIVVDNENASIGIHAGPYLQSSINGEKPCNFMEDTDITPSV